MKDSPPHPDDERDETGFLQRLFDRIRLGGFSGWLGDWRRFWWALIALNLRKTLFAVRGRRSHCPCQHPSDSGRAWETDCDAVVHWSSPERFRRVCPLLNKAPDGRWRCSVDTANVRPFWARAAAWAAGTSGSLYFVCALLAFAFLRIVGYPVGFPSVVWPPAWHEVREARARYFLQKAEIAIRANRAGEAFLSLAQSYRLNPRDYVTGRILAQLWQSSGTDVSNQIYEKLMAEHPAQRAETAEAWYLSLFARGDFKLIEALAWERLQAAASDAGPWLNTLIIASRRTGDDTFLEKVSDAPALPGFAKQACTWELMARKRPPEEMGHVMTAPIPANANVYLTYYRIDWLIRAGYAGNALFQLDQAQDPLPLSDQCRFYLDVYASLGWQSILQDQVGKFLSARPNSPAILEMICAHLIRYPNAAILTRVADAIDRFPPEPRDRRLGAYMSLYCAAGAAGDWKRLEAAKTSMDEIAGRRITGLDAIGDYFRTKGHRGPIERYLPALPSLSLNVMDALYAYSDSHP